jgi:hypothetical protein
LLQGAECQERQAIALRQAMHDSRLIVAVLDIHVGREKVAGSGWRTNSDRKG